MCDYIKYVILVLFITLIFLGVFGVALANIGIWKTWKEEKGPLSIITALFVSVTTFVIALLLILLYLTTMNCFK